MTVTKNFRNLIGKMAQVNPSKIQLSTETISPNFIPNDDCGHSWANCGENHDRIFGINLNTPKCIELNISKNYSYNRNGDVEEQDGEELQEYLERTEESYELFLVHNYGIEDNGNHNIPGKDFESWVLYKSPNFEDYFKKVEIEDLDRWNSWLNK